MRKHGWQLPYHPLQVVAVAVFLALGFAFYVFFAPFVGQKMFQYVVMGIYTPLLICAIGLYIWCAAADPADPGVFKSKKYLKVPDKKKLVKLDEAKRDGESTSSIPDATNPTNREEANVKGKIDTVSELSCNNGPEKKNSLLNHSTCITAIFASLPCTYICSSRGSSDQHCEDGMFYCSLCEVEVFKFSKHCRVCDKCVDCFDHHCRWLNNCVGKKNYRKFFTLMVSALLLLILQWSSGILVLILCFLRKQQFTAEISSKLGSSFTVVPFVIVVAVCTILAMIATLPLAQLFFFHILLIRKGISTYDYIIALREQEQHGGGGQQSPPMSPVSSITGLSSASSFNTFHRAAWCTPPRLFVEDQFDAIPPDNGSVSSVGKRTLVEEQMKKKNPAAVKISPWALARLNAEDVSKAAAEARKKSKILRPVVRHESSYAQETDSSGRWTTMRPPDGHIHFPTNMPFESSSLDPQNSRNHHILTESSSRLHLEARNPYRVRGAGGIVASSPESSLDSPDIHPLRGSTSRADEMRYAVISAPAATQNDIPLSRSTSDGYDASGGEDSDRVPTRNLHRSINWNNLLFGPEQDRFVPKSVPSLK